MKYSIVPLLFLCTFGLATSLHAQVSQAGQLLQADVNVDMIPQNPGPNQKVSVALTSYTTDINSASITWQVNGKTVKSGRGEKAFNFITGGTNQTTSLDITIVTFEGQTINKSYRIRPVGIDLTWQSNGFVPPFYKGKSMFSHQDKITFIAIPHMTIPGGGEISPKNLLYKWTRNGSAEDAASGYGKNTLTVVGPLISRSMEVDVQVTSPSADGVGYATVKVDPVEPSILFYEKNPLYGIEFQRALHDTFIMTDSKEITLVGVPLFFGVSNYPDSVINYKWTINGLSINNNPNSYVQVFRQKEGVSGTSNIGLSIENTDKILQYASNKFSLEFGKVSDNTNSISF